MMLRSDVEFAPLAATLPNAAGPIGSAGEVAREFLAAVRTEVRTRHELGAGGIALVAAYTEAVDRLVRFLFEGATAHFRSRYARINQRCAIVAQGGYGRGELNPASDIDLLFLFPWKVNPYVEWLAEVLLYGLWDAGLTVGHGLRNVRECGRLAARDLTVKTAVLDGRLLCGDHAVYEELAAQLRTEVWTQNPTHFFKEKLGESIDRYARRGDSIYLLQPHLKEGPGGLRDLHTAFWMAKVKFKVFDFAALVSLGVVTDTHVEELEQALDFLWRVRNAMHIETQAHTDVLSFELQDRIAPTLGFPGERSGVVEFMRIYYRHAATVSRFSELVIGRCLQAGEPYRVAPPRLVRDGMRVHGRTLSVAGREVFRRRPAAVVEVFAETQRHGVTLAPGTRELIRDALPLLAGSADEPAVAAALRAIVRARGHVFETLGEMHRLGVLTAAVPEFGNLDCLIAHDPFHVYTVDQHSLIGVREIERLAMGEFAKSLPHLTQVMQEMPQPELLILGMLFHDVGKGHGHDHSGRGARMMRAIGARLGLNEDETAACEFLVQHHLLMSHLAQRRDVRDDQLVVDFCRTVGTVENLQRLYVLTYADMRAVGPGVWSNWRDALLSELYVRARECFEKGVFEPEDRGARASRVRERVVRTAPQRARAELERFVAAMPDSYFLSTPEEMIARHGDLRRDLETRARAEPPPVVAIQVTAFPERGYVELAACTQDRPGLFAMLSGVLAAHGLNVLTARIATGFDGVALDAFRLSRVDEVDPERWERVERTVRDVVLGTVDVEELVDRSGRPSILTRPGRRVRTRVEIDNDVSREYTVLDVYTRDRVGVLFTITNCLYHQWLVIHLAKINTMVDQVLDVFYVRDHEGGKVEDPARLEGVRQALMNALESDGTAMEARAAEG